MLNSRSYWGIMKQNFSVTRSKKEFVSHMPEWTLIAAEDICTCNHGTPGLPFLCLSYCRSSPLFTYYSYIIQRSKNQTFPTCAFHGSFSVSLPQGHAKATVKSMTPKVSLRNVFYYLLSLPFPIPIYLYDFL